MQTPYVQTSFSKIQKQNQRSQLHLFKTARTSQAIKCAVKEETSAVEKTQIEPPYYTADSDTRQGSFHLQSCGQTVDGAPLSAQ